MEGLLEVTEPIVDSCGSLDRVNDLTVEELLNKMTATELTELYQQRCCAKALIARVKSGD
jgi:hypothetical protein